MERPDLTHVDAEGRLRMVDVTEKAQTLREARAEGLVRLAPDTLARVTAGALPKGNVFEAARLAGIMAAKRTFELIPLCHPLLLTGIEVELTPDPSASVVRIASRVRTTGPTGVEMEALTAVAAAALTIYDMCKAVEKGMVIEAIRLVAKSGGKSGEWRREAP